MNRMEHISMPHSPEPVLPIASLLAGALTLLNGDALAALVPELRLLGNNGNSLSEALRAASGAHPSPRFRQVGLSKIPARQKSLSIVIPCRRGSYPRVTLESLARQAFRDFDVIVSFDQGRGANWARNQGFRLVRTAYVLFSDDDIDWRPDALARLKAGLDRHPEVSYSYGTYVIPGIGVRANVPFDPARLKRVNYISTMSMIRTRDFPRFDESIRRFQDWDLWLTMLAKGKIGVHCGGAEIFHTRLRPGITYGNPLSAAQATMVIKAKHRLR
jgi:hypothetical protein